MAANVLLQTIGQQVAHQNLVNNILFQQIDADELQSNFRLGDISSYAGQLQGGILNLRPRTIIHALEPGKLFGHMISQMVNYATLVLVPTITTATIFATNYFEIVRTPAMASSRHGQGHALHGTSVSAQHQSVLYRKRVTLQTSELMNPGGFALLVKALDALADALEMRAASCTVEAQLGAHDMLPADRKRLLRDYRNSPDRYFTDSANHFCCGQRSPDSLSRQMVRHAGAISAETGIDPRYMAISNNVISVIRNQMLNPQLQHYIHHTIWDRTGTPYTARAPMPRISVNNPNLDGYVVESPYAEPIPNLVGVRPGLLQNLCDVGESYRFPSLGCKPQPRQGGADDCSPYDIQIYDAGKEEWVTITRKEAIQHCGVFTQLGKATLEAIARSMNEEGDDYFSNRGMKIESDEDKIRNAHMFIRWNRGRREWQVCETMDEIEEVHFSPSMRRGVANAWAACMTRGLGNGANEQVSVAAPAKSAVLGIFSAAEAPVLHAHDNESHSLTFPTANGHFVKAPVNYGNDGTEKAPSAAIINRFASDQTAENLRASFTPLSGERHSQAMTIAHVLPRAVIAENRGKPAEINKQMINYVARLPAMFATSGESAAERKAAAAIQAGNTRDFLDAFGGISKNALGTYVPDAKPDSQILAESNARSAGVAAILPRLHAAKPPVERLIMPADAELAITNAAAAAAHALGDHLGDVSAVQVTKEGVSDGFNLGAAGAPLVALMQTVGRPSADEVLDREYMMASEFKDIPLAGRDGANVVLGRINIFSGTAVNEEILRYIDLCDGPLPFTFNLYRPNAMALMETINISTAGRDAGFLAMSPPIIATHNRGNDLTEINAAAKMCAVIVQPGSNSALSDVMMVEYIRGYGTDWIDNRVTYRKINGKIARTVYNQADRSIIAELVPHDQRLCAVQALGSCMHEAPVVINTFGEDGVTTETPHANSSVEFTKRFFDVDGAANARAQAFPAYGKSKLSGRHAVLNTVCLRGAQRNRQPDGSWGHPERGVGHFSQSVVQEPRIMNGGVTEVRPW